MKKIFKGKDVQSAIKKGLKKLDISRDEVEVEIIEEKPLILFGLLGGGTKVRFRVESLAALADWKKTCRKVEEYTKMITGLIDEEVKVKVQRKKQKVAVNIDSDQKELIIGRKGATLKAIEYILNLIIKRDPSTRVDVQVDCGGYKKNIGAKITDKVKKAVKKVKRENKSIELEPMTSEKRKQVHREIQQIKGVESESTGRGKSRRVVIKRNN